MAEMPWSGDRTARAVGTRPRNIRHMSAAPALAVTLDAVIVAVAEQTPMLLTVGDALPAGPLAAGDPTLQLGLRRVVAEQAGIQVGYLEQLYTLGDLARSAAPGARHLSVTYLALVHEVEPSSGARWRSWYELFPWEDRRAEAAYVPTLIEPLLRTWIDEAGGGHRAEIRRERSRMAFGIDGTPWDGIRVLERYELLYELGAVAEAHRDRDEPMPSDLPPSVALGGDARRVAATGLGRLRGKLTYRPVVFELLPETFTLSRLQEVVEALGGTALHKQNFRRLVDRGGLVEATGDHTGGTGGRPAALFRFRRGVLLERPRPGLGHPSRG